MPADFHQRQVALLAKVGRRVTKPLRDSAIGATTRMFASAARLGGAPLAALGMYRIGEDGRLYLTTKSEHYHTPLGHQFPGYRLIDYARAAGIPNATHNNTRGHVTRLLEEELVCLANGVGRDRLPSVVGSTRPGVMNRVLNLETGSLAAEAAIKLVLGRFYRIQSDSPKPRHAGRRPVLLVVGDREAEPLANYHGTTMVAQMMRGMWPALRSAWADNGTLEIRAVPHNDTAALERAFADCQRPPRKVAGFFHELVLMNHGAIALDRSFVRRAYALCRRHDVPTVVDEIQTGLWSPELLMFREYGLRPSAAAVGKGFPGGEYCASRLIFSAGLDSLPQFGALVTNGQEELASLAYLITMRWAAANAEVTAGIGEEYEQRVRESGDRHAAHIQSVQGRRHLLAIHFHELETAKAFVAHMVEGGLDISVQTYKANCPPAALTKLPLIAGHETVEFVVERMEQAMRVLGKAARA